MIQFNSFINEGKNSVSKSKFYLVSYTANPKRVGEFEKTVKSLQKVYGPGEYDEYNEVINTNSDYINNHEKGKLPIFIKLMNGQDLIDFVIREHHMDNDKAAEQLIISSMVDSIGKIFNDNDERISK